MAFSIEDYEQVKEYGQGGMAIVYSAIQKSLNRKVAIKRMKLALSEDKSNVKRFENEAKLAASLEHENIIRIYDYGVDHGIFSISMEMVDGQDFDRILNSKHFVKELGLMVVLGACRGLHYAHQNKITHRDFKPSNILVSKQGIVKILDFGLASLSGTDLGLTQSNMVVGTPLFMSPEQALGEKNNKERQVDIFAVGVLLYKIFSGIHPFEAESLPTLMHNIVYTKEIPIEEACPFLPGPLAELINRCLEKKIENRLPELTPLILTLENYVYDLKIRSTAQAIEKITYTKSSGVFNFFRKFLQYHIKWGEKFSESGHLKKSKAHFLEGLKYAPKDKTITSKIRALEARLKMGEETPSGPAPDLNMSDSFAVPASIFQQKKANTTWIALGLGTALMAIIVFVFFLFPKSKQSLPAKGPSSEETNSGKLKNQSAKTPARVPFLEGKGKQAEPPKPADLKPAIKKVKTNHLSSRFNFKIKPSSARVYLNKKRVSKAELRNGKKVVPGKYQLEIKARGYKPYKRTVTVRKNQKSLLTEKLTPIKRVKKIKKSPAPKTATGFGQVHVFSTPSANLFIDGRARGATPTSRPIKLRKGKHVLILKKSGYRPYEEIITVPDGEILRKKIRLQK